jgi:hypothetical protein
MIKTLRKVATVTAVLAVAGCTYSESGCMVGHYCLVPFDGGSAHAADWTPAPAAAVPVDVAAANCDMIAHGMAPSGESVFAFGSPTFVGATMAGATLSQGMRQMASVQNTIKDCMIVHGFRRVRE